MGLGHAAAQVVGGDPPGGAGGDPPGLQLRGGLKGRAGVPGQGTVRQAGGMADNLTLMAVHAHPDDEASSTGGVLAHYAAEGVRTVVVTCTNGEFGDAPGWHQARRRRS